MCGRYVIAYGPEMLVHGFSATRVVPFPQRFNVAPQSQVPVVFETRDGERVAELMRWGLVPHWAKDAGIGHKLNNARAETMADKPSFRQAVRRRRCIVPASGFYEWQAVAAGTGGARQPWYISPKDDPVFAFAGLFEAWRPHADAEGKDMRGESEEWMLTCCIVTTAPNAIMAPIHDRMPVILKREDEDAWLDPKSAEPTLLSLLAPYDPGKTALYRVDVRVNSVKNDDPQCLARVDVNPD